MTELSNYHAHTTFADGTETIERMIEAAIAKGCVYTGISEHSEMLVPYDEPNLTPETTPIYLAQMRAAAEKYAGRITVLTGIEQEYFSDAPTAGCDYVIGSVHFVHKNGAYFAADFTKDKLTESINRHYGGDFYAFAEDYYKTASAVARKTRCDIVGHFDLINKFNEGDSLFDTSHPRYRAAAIDAMVEVLERCPLFEVNTGAMYRLGRTEPYPQPWLLRELLERGGEVILSSDSHDGASIGYKFPEMEELLRAVGFKYRKILTPDGFADIAL
ncbi:MAG: histidinol-phosphatase [Oscillospiraceae bacterium]|jgi:histidinol-phosphatase (PHP family)|nr:histidinol-phosphatase [Oscillospiraceae bacterium]